MPVCITRIAELRPRRAAQPRAVVAPHAGYVYSGAVAASALALAAHARLVVLLGPSHFVALDGLAVSSAEVAAIARRDR